MITRISRTISKSQYDTLLDTYSDEDSLTLSQAQSMANGTQMRPFQFGPESEQVSVVYVPHDLSHIVNFDQPALVESSAVVLNRNIDKAWTLDVETVSNIDCLPELRQAFCEGESYENRDADYKYHFADGSTEIAHPASNPVDRPESIYTISALESIGGAFPRKWLAETQSGDELYIRERSGQVRVYDQKTNTEIFNAFIGREHPGMCLTDEEILEIVTAVDYIQLPAEYSSTVSQKTKDNYWS